MKEMDALTRCSKCIMSRRNFLATGCIAGAGAAGLLSATKTAFAADAAGDAAKSKLQIVFALHAVKQPGPDWPNVGFDFAPVIERITTTLRNACP